MTEADRAGEEIYKLIAGAYARLRAEEDKRNAELPEGWQWVPAGPISTDSRREENRDQQMTFSQTYHLVYRPVKGSGKPVFVADADGEPGCPVQSWDGPYPYRCSMGPHGGICHRHGPYPAHEERR